MRCVVLGILKLGRGVGVRLGFRKVSAVVFGLGVKANHQFQADLSVKKSTWIHLIVKEPQPSDSFSEVSAFCRTLPM